MASSADDNDVDEHGDDDNGFAIRTYTLFSMRLKTLQFHCQWEYFVMRTN